MKYVDDLTKVKPEDIQHAKDEYLDIQAIIKTRNSGAPNRDVVVIFEDGSSASYTIDGRFVEKGERRFIFIPKKKLRLKPLGQILTEHTMVWNGFAFSNDKHPHIHPRMFVSFDQVYTPDLPQVDDLYKLNGFYFSKEWFEEVEA